LFRADSIEGSAINQWLGANGVRPLVRTVTAVTTHNI